MKKERKMGISNKVIAFFVVLITIVNLIFYISVYEATLFPEPTALVSSGSTVTLCLNREPQIIQTCNQTATVSTLYTCDVNVNDSDSTSFTFSENTTLFTINSGSGLINFTPQSNDVRGHRVNITVDDNSGCSNNKDFSVLNLNISSAGGGDTGRVTETEGDSRRQEAEAGEEVIEIEIPKEGISGIELEFVKTKLKVGEGLEREVVITNKGESPLPIELRIEGVEDIASVDNTKFVLNPGESKIIRITFNAPSGLEPDVYSGGLILDTPSFSKTIPTVVEVETKETLFKQSISVLSEFEEIKPEGGLQFQIDIENLLGEIRDIMAIVIIKDTKNNVVKSEFKEMTFDKGVSFLGEWNIPTNLPSGKYVLAMIVKSGESVSTASEVFEVGKLPALELPKATFNRYIVYMNFLVIAVAGAILIIFMRKRKN